MNPNKFRIISLLILFGGFISFPFINNRLGLVSDTPSLENRAMAKEPVFDIEHLDPFPASYEPYYNDHFSLRARIIKYFNTINLKAFKKSPFPETVIVGYNDWLYLGGNEIKTYLGRERFTIEQLEAWRLELEFQKNYLAKRGCTFYFMITPSKANIHTENIPHTYYRLNTQSWAEQLYAYLKKYSDINVISIFDEFRELKKDNQLYYKHDNHWNNKGAFYAAELMSTRIGKDFPNVKPLSLSDFKVTKIPKTGGDILALLGNDEGYMDSDYEITSNKTLKTTETGSSVFAMHNDAISPEVLIRDSKDNSKPKLMMVSDSYSRLLFPFFAESFSRSVKIFDQWHYSLYPDLVEKEKPDVYVMMVFEGWSKSIPTCHIRLKDK